VGSLQFGRGNSDELRQLLLLGEGGSDLSSGRAHARAFASCWFTAGTDRRRQRQSVQVRWSQEKRNIDTPMELTINVIARFGLAIEALDRTPKL
jgi:hypothetical protein